MVKDYIIRFPNEEKLAYDIFYDLQKEKNESPLEFTIRNGWELYIYRMFCVDYLTRVFHCFFLLMEMKKQ